MVLSSKKLELESQNELLNYLKLEYSHFTKERERFKETIELHKKELNDFRESYMSTLNNNNNQTTKE
ncbi:hypothetical protein DLAC_05077 [Tieghemostelium lacteum]|uniref:Uncharacterized protein n=1 Tax=Tieghemostelium lacteum TaxID=361077 RepID=A0A151ZII1_TIELA|nr:hypothetical protein DLAC_05077 [Tieghemostelium lacteum]|eukprot:KYQ93690.1 hypothetical protein DLAC_05077 [Tieghemostelium lacteum]